MDPGERPRIDLHVHAKWSADAIGGLDELARTGMRKGLDGLALTEHNTTRHHIAIKRWNRDHKDRPFVFYPGTEITTQQGHLLAIGIHYDIPKRLPLEEALDHVERAGGVAIPAHPQRPITGIGEVWLNAITRRIRVLETYNAQQTPQSNERAAAHAQERGLGATGGSDAHQVHDVGNAYTIMPEPVSSLDDLLDQLSGRKTLAEGHRTRWLTRARQRVRIGLRWATLRYP